MPACTRSTSEGARPTTRERWRTASPTTWLPTYRAHSSTSQVKAVQRVVPPAGFEPALPPPETGRLRDRGRLRTSYVGFLFASCVSDALRRAVVRSTGDSTLSVLIGRTRRPVVLRKVSVVL